MRKIHDNGEKRPAKFDDEDQLWGIENHVSAFCRCGERLRINPPFPSMMTLHGQARHRAAGCLAASPSAACGLNFWVGLLVRRTPRPGPGVPGLCLPRAARLSGIGSPRNRASRSFAPGGSPSRPRSCGFRSTTHATVSAGANGPDLEANAIEAAKKAGVKHVVKLSVIGADNPVLIFSKWHAGLGALQHRCLRVGRAAGHTLRRGAAGSFRSGSRRGPRHQTRQLTPGLSTRPRE